MLGILLLATDGPGIQGGIARYNQQLIGSLASFPGIDEIVLIARHGSAPLPVVGATVQQRPAATRGLQHFLIEALRQLAPRHRPDLVICGHINLMPVAALAATYHHVPLLLILHGVEGWVPPAGRLARRLIRRCDRVICVSSTTRSRFLQWAPVPPEAVSVILNAIDLRAYGPGGRPNYLVQRHGLHGQRVILTMGRMDARERAKGFDEVLDILPELLQQEPDICYLVVGEGSDRPRLEAKADTLGLADRVTFTGWVAEGEKADYFRLADAYVMPSRMEGFGYVFTEALACGIPLVGSRFDGGADALDFGRLGELVDPKDRQELLKAVVRAIGCPRRVPDDLDRFSLGRYDRELFSLVSEMTGGLQGPTAHEIS